MWMCAVSVYARVKCLITGYRCFFVPRTSFHALISSSSSSLIPPSSSLCLLTPFYMFSAAGVSVLSSPLQDCHTVQGCGWSRLSLPWIRNQADAAHELPLFHVCENDKEIRRIGETGDTGLWCLSACSQCGCISEFWIKLNKAAKLALSCNL